MAVSQSYIGKAVDVCVLETPSYGGIAPVNIAISDSGSAISGPYKVVQKFFKCLMTDKGSVASEPEYGTSFVTKLFGGQIHTSLALSFAFYSEKNDIINYIKSSVLAPSVDEALEDVALEGLSVTLDSAVMSLRFTFQDSSTILVPVTISTV
jgi:hypothetical protein